MKIALGIGIPVIPMVRDKGGGNDGSDPHWSNVVFLSGFEGANNGTVFVDESSKGHTITPVSGSVITSSTYKQFGATALKPVSTGGVTIADSDDFYFPGQFTVEGFVGGSSTATGGIGQYISATNQRSWSINFWYQFGQQLRFLLSTAGSSAQISRQFEIPDIISGFIHVAMDRDASNVVRYYLNGAMLGKDTLSGALFNSSAPFEIGSYNNGERASANTYYDEVRITKGVARYASDAGFAVPTEPYPRG